MNILLVDLQYDYGQKARGSNLIGEWGFRRAMQAAGHNVHTFYYDDDLDGSAALQKRLLDVAQDLNPDLIVFCLFRNQFTEETLRTLSKRFKTLNWFGDDTWRFDSFTSTYAPYFRICVTTDKYSVARYKQLGVQHVICSQWAALDTQSRPPFTNEYDHDVSFVGQWHPYRNWFFKELKKAGIHVECFGHGWKNGALSADGMNKVFARSKISLNVGNSESYDLRYLTSHPKAFALAARSWLKGTGKTRSQIKARNFEIPFFGGFQLTDYVPGIEDYFAVGKEISCFRDFDEAATLIRYYLADDTKRETQRRAGFERAASHGYTNRWREILAEVEKF